jgi:hypothetical protein
MLTEDHGQQSCIAEAMDTHLNGTPNCHSHFRRSTPHDWQADLRLWLGQIAVIHIFWSSKRGFDLTILKIPLKLFKSMTPLCVIMTYMELYSELRAELWLFLLTISLNVQLLHNTLWTTVQTQTFWPLFSREHSGAPWIPKKHSAPFINSQKKFGHANKLP